MVSFPKIVKKILKNFAYVVDSGQLLLYNGHNLHRYP